MERHAVAETVRTAGQVYRRQGLTGLLPTAMEYAISQPRLHPRVHRFLASRYYHRRCQNDVAGATPPIDPFKLEWVSPDRITRHTRREYPPYRDRLALFGTVRGGEWDRRDAPPVDSEYEGPPSELFIADRFEATVLYRSLSAHFEDGRPWDETELVATARRLVDEPTPERVWHECTTNAAIDQRCKRLDELYESIRTTGYRSERSRLGTDPAVGFRHCLRQEVTVDIGRDGELLIVSGRHRLAIAKLLGLEALPVVFLVRHAGWMRRRAAVAGGEGWEPEFEFESESKAEAEAEAEVKSESEAEYKSHPDLRDLAP